METITVPLETLTLLLQRLSNKELETSIKPPDPCAEDIRSVYAVLEELRHVMMFTSKSFAKNGGMRALLAYSAASQLFARHENLKGRAVSLYCIGRLHFQAGRFVEAVQAIRESIHIGRSLEERSTEPQMKYYYKVWVEKRTLQMVKVMLVIAEEVSIEVLDDAVFYMDAMIKNADLSVLEKAQLQLQLSLASILQSYPKNRLEIANRHLEEAERLMAKFDVPDFLLDFKSYTEALLYEALEKPKKAAITFTQILERSPKLNPRMKALCIKHLHKIFQFNGLVSPQLIENYAGLNRRKDVVFLMDYSLSMEGPRIARAIKGYVTLFDNALVPEDKLSFIVFNRFPQVIFDLTYKGRNSVFLRKSIENCKQ